MKTQHIMAVCLALAIGFIAASFTPQPEENKVYEYMSLRITGGYIFISKSDGTYDKVNVRNELNGPALHRDITPILKRISQFEEQGWQMASANEFGDDAYPTFHVLLRREKK